MGRQLVIGIDLGTTSVKACAFQTDGHVIAEVEEMTKTEYPKQGYAQQDVELIERSSVLALKRLIAEANIIEGELLAISFSAAMHSLVCIDESGTPISPLLTWADGRSTDQVKALSDVDKQHYYEITGTPVHPMTPFTKLLWMKETNYAPYLAATYFMSAKEYIIYKWFGKRLIDYAMASATGLFNPNTLQWEPTLLQLTNIVSDQLSTIVEPTTILTELSSDIAKEVGISASVPFVIGSADGQLANLGSGAILPGEVAISVGTSGAIRQFTSSFQVSETQSTFCYSFSSDSFIVGGPTNNGGVVLQWTKDLLQYDGDFAAFISESEKSEIGSEGLVFLPYLNGERAPLWDQAAKGNFYGLSISHRREHLIRAVLEGITLNLYQIGNALEQSIGPTHKVFVNGGLSRSPVWLQMLADIFNAEIYVSESHNGAAWGASWTALVALGYASSFEDIKNYTPMNEPVVPIAENSEKYKAIYEKYISVQQVVAQLF
ncbi:gluconokinase [Paenibacillus endoradicis]|uniref:gluconokinase n=1 Tax=Paenibacillus endoradicis TaxID=2972487 RepID=UPI0021591DAC|nr:gluconokinase [Paenibacillus endoradicis]MCR8656408.1 gluconokinase [Paenibacillus endoradicis]